MPPKMATRILPPRRAVNNYNPANNTVISIPRQDRRDADRYNPDITVIDDDTPPLATNKRKRNGEAHDGNGTFDTDTSERMNQGQGREMPPHAERDYTDIITIIVGADSKVFMVHRDLICNVSTFFKAACSKEWIEGQTRKVTVPELDSEIFCYYVDWVYAGKLDERKMEQYPIPHVNPEDSDDIVKWMTGASVTNQASRISAMSDYLGDAHCRNACMELLVHHSNQFAGGGLGKLLQYTINFIANNAPEGSGLFRWMVDDLLAATKCMGNDMASLVADGAVLPTVVKDAMLVKLVLACRPGNKLEPVGEDASKYFD